MWGKNKRGVLNRTFQAKLTLKRMVCCSENYDPPSPPLFFLNSLETAQKR